MNGPRGDKMAWCPSDAHFIFRSVMPGRKQSQVTDLMWITCEVLPFRKTKLMEGIIPTLFFPPALARQRISSWENSVDIVRRLCKGLIRGAFTALPKVWHSCFLLAYHIVPIMTQCRTLLITWIPGRCGSNWADSCWLPGLETLGRSVVEVTSCPRSAVGFPFTLCTHLCVIVGTLEQM